MGEREAFLKLEYAPWYTGVPSEQWISAHTVQYLVRFQLRYGEPTWECCGRLLNPEHFRFRGGESSAGGEGERRSVSAVERPAQRNVV